MGKEMSNRKLDRVAADHVAFQKAWIDYPSQDNEGYSPDRGGFKCGWFAALRWERARLAKRPQRKKAGR